MASLSIRHMNFTLQELEQLQAHRDAEWYAKLPAEVKANRSHYWHIQRRDLRNPSRWIFVREFIGTKQEAAEHFTKYLRNHSRYTFRLKHLLAY